MGLMGALEDLWGLDSPGCCSRRREAAARGRHPAVYLDMKRLDEQEQERQPEEAMSVVV